MQGVHHRNRARAHGEDIANDPAGACSRTLVRLDERRMVVRFDFEYGNQAIANIDNPGVFARPLHNRSPFSRQTPEVDLGALIAAVLRPHHREDSQLSEVRLAPEDAADPLVLRRLKAMAGNNFICKGFGNHSPIGKSV
jgi:hypothetical protein